MPTQAIRVEQREHQGIVSIARGHSTARVAESKTRSSVPNVFANCTPDSLDEVRTLVEYVDAFSQGSAVLDARDPEIQSRQASG
jgi:hypothetical protein